MKTTPNTKREEKKENEKLKDQLAYVQTNAFIENEARDKLFLVFIDSRSFVSPALVLAGWTRHE